MSNLDRQIYRILFENKMFKSNADEFQNLFEVLMKNRHGENFCIVKPYGNIGDMKNDGFLRDSNIYFQVYGPEDITKSIEYAISKIKEDANGLIAKWNNAKIIKYVVNDKFLGVRPDAYQLIDKLKTELSNLSSSLDIDVVLVSCADLENEFMRLTDEQMMTVVDSHYCNVSLEDGVDLSAIKELVDHILNIEVPSQQTSLFPPDYDLKIKKNCFSEIIASRLKEAHLNASDIEIFFSQYGEVVEEEIKDRFVFIYKNVKDTVPNTIEHYGDNIYYLIMDSIKPNNKRGTIAAIENLIAYYFECCDIFEAPKED